MANNDVKIPKFYPDIINHLMATGTAQNGNFDLMSGTDLISTLNAGSEAELFDMNPLNQVHFETSASSSIRADHVLLNINTGGDYTIDFVAILNHNLNINQVPTIIVNSETIKIYEGEIAKQFLLDVYNNMFPEKQNEEVISIQDNKEEVSSIQDVVSKEEVSSIQDVASNEEVSSIQDVVSNKKENEEKENKEIDLMSKVEELQKVRESMIASEKTEPKESQN